jgi:hypothetical protein
MTEIEDTATCSVRTPSWARWRRRVSVLRPEDAEKAATEIEICNDVTFVSQGYAFAPRLAYIPDVLTANGMIITRVAAADVKPDNPQVYPDWVDTSEHRDAKHVIDHILGGKIGAPGRQALRKAIDTVDAGPQGRAKHDQALGRALRLSPTSIVP